MILQGHRALACLSHVSSQCLDKQALVSLAFNITRVSSFRQRCLGSHEVTFRIRPVPNTLLPYRPYATKAVSRPKAHTGRTTTAPRKKASTAKAATAGSTKAAKKPVAKKASPKKAKTKTKSKRRTRAKSTKAPKKSAKAKKPKLTPEQKTRREIKALKEKALTPPKQLPFSAFSVLLAERAKEERVPIGQGADNLARSCSTRYKSFSPEEREHYNHIANQNKATNASRYREWIKSFTPIQIHEANNARLNLNRRTTGKLWQKLQDERLVKRFRTPYNLFYVQRFRSGDFAGMRVPEAAKLIGSEWRGLNAGEKQKFAQLAEEDTARYEQEVKAVYNRDVVHQAAKAA